jgi:hypothetical protein
MVDKPTTEFSVRIPVKGEGEDTATVAVSYFYCQEGNEGLCKVGGVVFTLPLKVSSSATESTVILEHKVE